MNVSSTFPDNAPKADASGATRSLNGWPFVKYKARIDLPRFLMGIGYERAIEYAWIFRALGIRRAHKFIDIGTGTTSFPLYVKHHTGAEVHAVDLDASILRLIDYAKKAGLGSSVADGTLVIRHIAEPTLPYPDETFDRLACISVIEHSPDDGVALREMLRVMKPGGILGFSVPIDARHRDVYVEESVYERKFGGQALFYERQYDHQTIFERLIEPSRAELLDLQAFGETRFQFGQRVVYHPKYGIESLLKPLRWTLPAFAHRFIQPVALQNPPPRSFCCFALRKKADN